MKNYLKEKIKNIYLAHKGKILVIFSIALALGVIQIANFTIKTYISFSKFIDNPVGVEIAYADVRVPTRADKQWAYNDQVPVEVIKDEIRKQAKEFGVDEKFMLDLAFCESTYNNLAKNDTSTALGIYQFLIKTWEQTDSFKNHKIARTDYKANIEEAMKAIKKGEDWRWEECLK